VVEASAKLNSSPEKIGEAVDRLVSERKDMMKNLDAMKKDRVGETVEDLVQKAEKVGEVRIVRHVETEDMKHLVSLAKELISYPKTIAVLGSDQQGAKVVIARSPDVSVDCRPLIKKTMEIVGGSGGGKPDFAQGGGQNAGKLEEALDSAMTALKAILEKE